jgi:hypothetical protein
MFLNAEVGTPSSEWGNDEVEYKGKNLICENCIRVNTKLYSTQTRNRLSEFRAQFPGMEAINLLVYSSFGR